MSATRRGSFGPDATHRGDRGDTPGTSADTPAQARARARATTITTATTANADVSRQSTNVTVNERGQKSTNVSHRQGPLDWVAMALTCLSIVGIIAWAWSILPA